jgi:Mn-containing catalase
LPGEPLYVAGDFVRLAQVFSNLLNNASKYSPEGSEIDLSAESIGPEAMVTVADEQVRAHSPIRELYPQIMYHHIKKLMFTVRVGEPDPRFGNVLLEQFGGANGELAAAMQYSIQGINCENMACKDLLMDIGTEELSHLEIIGRLARMHLKPMKKSADAAEHDPLIAIAGGGGVALCNSMGTYWTADYLKITGDLDVDLHSNIAAAARAKIVYERLINFCDDAGTKEALQFLMTREITHMRAFMQALDSLGGAPLSVGFIPPTPDIVDQYYNDSTGKGDQGEVDTTGPWNTQEGISVIEAPALNAFQVLKATPKAGRTTLNNGKARVVTPRKSKR